MKKNSIPPADAAELRRRAEARLEEKKKGPVRKGATPLSADETQRLLQELQIHEVELEMQNEELAASRAEVEASLALYTDLYDFAPVGYFTLGRDGKICRANLTGARLLNVERGQLTGRRFGLFVSEADRPAFNAFLEKVFGGRGRETSDVMLCKEKKSPLSPERSGNRGLDGTDLCIVQIEAVPSEDGQKCSMVMIDITERKRMEEALENEHSLLRNLIDNVPDRIYAKDTEGRFIICNEAMIRRMGKTSMSEIVGKTDFDLLPLEMAQRFCADEQAIIRSGTPLINREEPLTTEGGKITRWNLATKVPLLDKQGNRIGIVGIGREITDLKQSEQKLKDTLDNLRKAFGTTIQVMVSAIEARDPYTAGHQIRSADLARTIATKMGLPQEQIDGIRMAGSIHDIGKLSIPAEILSKPTKLTELEFSLIKEHSWQGYKILKDVESPWPLAEIVYQHHERKDGSGYPRNLKGEEIITEARIMAVADVVEAMASHRPYRAGLGIEVALEEIEKNRGILYDDKVVDACLRLFRKEGFRFAAA